jgi:hypothetical protein
MRELLPVSVLLVLILVPTADAQPVDEWIPNPVVTAGPPAVRVDPYLGVDPRFFTTGLQAELGLVPADLPLWYLPPIHAWQLPPQAYTEPRCCSASPARARPSRRGASMALVPTVDRRAGSEPATACCSA